MTATNRKIDVVLDESGCLLCTSHKKNSNGYPRYQYKKKQYIMARFIYEQCFGEIPNDLVIRHKCDNPACVNPEHLETGTQKENAQDRELRGRGANKKGEMNARSKLKESDVINISKRIISGKERIAEIAKEYSVNPSLVYAIKYGDRWNHLTNVREEQNDNTR